MFRTTNRLALALILSLLLHLFPFIGELIRPLALPPRPAPLQAQLRPPPAPASPELTLPEPPTPKPVAASPPSEAASPKKPAPRAANWQQEIRKQLRKRDEQGLYYPQEAIARGLEGQVLVFLILDSEGQVAASRVEESSGHRILDDAALRAVRALRALPADAPRETLLPVSFRLR